MPVLWHVMPSTLRSIGDPEVRWMRRLFGGHDEGDELHVCHRISPDECRDEQEKRETRERIQRMRDEIAVMMHQRGNENGHH